MNFENSKLHYVFFNDVCVPGVSVCFSVSVFAVAFVFVLGLVHVSAFLLALELVFVLRLVSGSNSASAFESNSMFASASNSSSASAFVFATLIDTHKYFPEIFILGQFNLGIRSGCISVLDFHSKG